MNYWNSTIGRKQLVGIGGIALALFVLLHMLGNLLLFVGPRAYNEYSHALTSNPAIYLAEVGLVLLFFVHVIFSLALQGRNWKARPEKYAVLSNGAKGTSAVKRSLWAQGIIILVFVVLHIITFKYGTYYSVDYGQGDVRDLYRLVLEVFQYPVYVIWYLICLILLGLHLSHGVASSFQTLGFNHPKYSPIIRKISLAYAVIVSVGFIVQPIYVYFFA